MTPAQLREMRRAFALVHEVLTTARMDHAKWVPFTCFAECDACADGVAFRLGADREDSAAALLRVGLTGRER